MKRNLRRMKSMFAIALSGILTLVSGSIPGLFGQSANVVHAESVVSLTYSGNGWGTAHQMNFEVKNESDQQVEDWKVVIKSTVDVQQIWCAQVTNDDGNTVFTPLDWNKVINPNSSTTFGMIVSGDYTESIDYTVSYKIGGVWVDDGQGDEPPVLSSDASLLIVLVENKQAIKISDTEYEARFDDRTKASFNAGDFNFQPNHDKATFTSISYDKTTGKAVFSVTAEDGTVVTYTVTVYGDETLVLSPDTSLKYIAVNGIEATQISDTEYEVILPEGENIADIHSGMMIMRATNSKAKVKYVRYSPSKGEGYFSVIAEDGTIKDYVVYVREATTGTQS